MNATRFTIFGALAACLLAPVGCDDKKADDKTDAKGKPDAKDEKADAKDADGKEEAKPDAKAEEAKPEGAEEGAKPAVTIGVAVCDEYLTKYGACIKEHAPEAMRAPMADALAKSAERFKKQSESPEKDSLEQACTAALDAVKKTSKGWGCTYE